MRTEDNTVSPHYDSMICKLITYGRTRKIAMDRMYRALSEYIIRGIDTNIEFVKAVVLDPAFRQGEATTSYVEEFLARAPKIYLKMIKALTTHQMTKKKPETEEEIIPTISEESSELGTIRINHSVVAGIVRLATQSVQGVVNVGGGGVVEGLTDFFSKKSPSGG